MKWYALKQDALPASSYQKDKNKTFLQLKKNEVLLATR